MNLSLADATSFINFGAFLGFTLVNVCVIAYAVRQWRSGNRPAAGAAVDGRPLALLDSTS